MNTAIIVAAGTGKRFGGDIPKQFLEINGKPILIYTLERFEQCDSIDQIVLVLSENEIQDFTQVTKKYSLTKLKHIVSGGNSRAESVFNGMKVINSMTADIIAVHDGARPLVEPSEIAETVKKAKETGASCLVAKVTDTIKEVADDRITKTIDRTNLRRAMTPQCFLYDVLKTAFEENDINEIATDECYLVEKVGFPITSVEGTSKNIKITHQEDFEIAKLYLSSN